MISTKFKPGTRVYYLLGDRKWYGVVADLATAQLADDRLGGPTPKVWAKWEHHGEIGFVYEYDTFTDKVERNLPDWF